MSGSIIPMGESLPAALAASPPPIPAPAPAPPAPLPFNFRLGVGLAGILVGAIMSGLGNRVGALGLADMRGALGLGADEGAWLNSVYLAGELVAMPFSCWLAITFSLRRFHLTMLTLFALLALCLPGAQNEALLLALRATQGLVGGMLVPVLMMSALRFLPPPIRLHGLALFALTATFAPNLAFWITGQWTDTLHDLRLIYWQGLPLAVLAFLMVYWGIPQDPVRLERLRQANWFGLVCACVGLSLLALGLDRGARLDWWRSDLISWLVFSGSALTGVFLLSEWFHPTPFLRPQLLGKRNLGLGMVLFFLLLMVLLSGSFLPAMHLERVWGYRSLQSAPIGLMIALPQLVLGSGVALLLYRQWVDARYVFAAGLALIAAACFLNTQITSQWIWTHFAMAQVLQAFGQPMAVVAMLFLGTSVVRPSEGPFVAGTINIFRVLATLFGNAVLGHFLSLRERFHADMLLDQAGGMVARLPTLPNLSDGLAASVRTQSFVLAAADSFWFLGFLALLLIPAVLCLQHVPAPQLPNLHKPTPAPLPNPARA